MDTSSVVDKLRDPGEKAAAVWLGVLSVPILALIALWVVFTFGLGLLVIGLIVLIRHLAELFAAAYIKTNAVEVGENQLPDVWNAVRSCCDRLGVQPPVTYVMQENVWNAFAMKLASKRVVVLLSGAIDSLLLKGDVQQLTFLIGHEIGHHAAGHLDFWRRLIECGGWLPWLLLWYRRRCELTCDRVGLYCTGDFRTAALAVANMAAGAQMAAQVNVDEAIAQWRRHSHELYVRYRTIYSTHPPLLWRLEEMKKMAGVMGMFRDAAPAPTPVEG